MAGGLAQAIGLGYAGRPRDNDGADSFVKAFSEGQAMQANRAAAKAKAEDEKRKSVEAVMKDMAVTTDMTPFFQREFTRRQAERIAALTEEYMNPSVNSGVRSINILSEFNDDLGYYTSASKDVRANTAKMEDAKKNGVDFFVSNNPITVGDRKYNNIYDALDQSQLADTEEGLAEIVKQGIVPGEWTFGKDSKGRSVISSTLNLTTVDPVSFVDKYVKPEDYSVYGDKPRQTVKGPFGEQRYVYDTMIAPDRADVISGEVSSNPNVVKYYGLEEWKRRKAENPSLTFQEFASDPEAIQSISKSVPNNVRGILQAKRGSENLDGRPQISSSGSKKRYEDIFSPRIYADTESGKYGVVINQGASDNQRRDWVIAQGTKVLDEKGVMVDLIDKNKKETEQFRGSTAGGVADEVFWNAADNTVYLVVNSDRNMSDPTDKTSQSVRTRVLLPMTEKNLAEYASVTQRSKDEVISEIKSFIPPGNEVKIGSDGIMRALHEQGVPTERNYGVPYRYLDKYSKIGVSSQSKPTKTGASGL